MENVFTKGTGRRLRRADGGGEIVGKPADRKKDFCRIHF